MGNCVSEYKEVNLRDDYEDDPSAFRVKIKRKNKLYTGKTDDPSPFKLDRYP